MEDMDIDIDFDTDPIKRFLQHKLNEVKLRNEELKQQMNRRKDLLKTCVEEMASKLCTSYLQIVNTWQKTNNGKWVIGIDVKSSSIDRAINDANVELKWNLSVPLTYSVGTFCQFKPLKVENTKLSKTLKLIMLKMEKKPQKDRNPLENEWIETQEIKESARIVIALEIPQLLDRTECEIYGILTYHIEGQQCQLNIPKFQIKATDFLTDFYEIKSIDIISGDEHAYFTTLITNERTDLVIQLPSMSYTSLENSFEFDCKFRKVNLLSQLKQFYVVVSIGETINGTLLVVEPENERTYNCTVYSRNQDSLQLFLHYLHQTIPNLILLPKKYKDKLLEAQNEDESILDNFKNNKLKEFSITLEAQINLIHKFCTTKFNELPEKTRINEEEVTLNVTFEDYQKFRKQLAEQELKSDLLYVTCSKYLNMSSKNEESYE